MNYILQFVNVENGYTTMEICPTIQDCLDSVKELMSTDSHKYRITISTKSNQ